MELLAHGATDAQKERWLWPNLRGEISSAFALTEPFFAGADPTVIGTTAVKDGDEWVIDGHKWFITNASVADIVLVFAETNPEGRPHRHASVFVVPTGTPGMEIVRDIGTMAHPTSSTGASGNHAEIVFRDCRVPADHLIGQPGRGIHARPAAARRRAHPPRHALARARRSDRSTSCASGPCPGRSHGKLLAQHQMVQDYVALSHMEIQAARLLTFQTAWKMDKYGAAAVRADLGMIKAHVSKVVLGVLDRTIQVCGALGYSSDLPVESWYRSTRFGPIGDGPDELHKSVLARTLLKGYTPGRGMADRAHPQPPAGGRGEVGRAARARRRRLNPCEAGPTTDAPRLEHYLDDALGGPRADHGDADGRWRFVRGVRARSRAGAVGAAARTAARQLGHRPRRAPGVPHPRRHQGRAGADRPRPFVACADRDVFGAPFYVMERIDGRPILQPVPERVGGGARDARAGARGARRRARRDPRRRLARRAGFGDLAHDGDYLSRQLTRWLAQLDSYGGRELPAARADPDWLDAHRPADQPSALCHGDYKLDNVLFAARGAAAAARRRRLGDGGDRRSRWSTWRGR